MTIPSFEGQPDYFFEPCLTFSASELAPDVPGAEPDADRRTGVASLPTLPDGLDLT